MKLRGTDISRVFILIIITGLLAGLVYTLNRYDKYTTVEFILLLGGYGAVLLFFQHVFRAWGKNSRQNLSLAIVSVICSLYAVEIAAGIFIGEPDVRLRAARRHDVEFDRRSPLQVAIDLRKKDKDVFPLLTFPGLRKSFNDKDGNDTVPLAGISEKRIIHCNESGNYLFFASDEYGFNNPAGSHSHSPDILLAGDSFAQGMCVDRGRDTAGILRANGYSVVSLGISGSGPLIHLAALREYAGPLRPPMVFWMYFESNDITDMLDESRFEILKKYLRPGFTQSLREKQDRIDEFIASYIMQRMEDTRPYKYRPFYKKAVQLWHIRKYIKAFSERTEEKPPPPPPDMFTDIVLRMKQDIAAWGGSMTAVYLPSLERYASETPDSGALFHRDAVLSVFREAGLPVIDVHPLFMAQRNPRSLFPLGVGPHYTEKGYALVGAAILDFLENNTKAGPGSVHKR